MDEVDPDSGFPQGGLSHLGCAPRKMLGAASLLCLLAFCCLTACSTWGPDLVVVGLGEGAVPQHLGGAAVAELLAGGPFSGTDPSALSHCQRSISPVLGSSSRPFPVLVAAFPITQGRLHRPSPRNANCFGLRLVQHSHWALRALSQLRDLPDPSSPSPGELVEVCCGHC